MADNLAVTPGSGATIGMDEISLGGNTVKVGYGKILDGTADSSNALVVNASGEVQSRDDDANTALTSIDGKITAVNTGAVVVSSSALPSGAATSAKQDTIIGHVDGIEGVLGTIDADTGNISTKIDTVATDTTAMSASLGSLDNAVDGNYLNVNANIAGTDMVSGSGTATGALRVELPTNGTGTVGLNAGTNAIGKLAANSGVDIGDVDVTSIAAGTNNIGQVSVAPQTANGLSVFNATSSDGSTALTNSAQAVKASAGQLYGWYIYNPNSSAQYVQLYNTAAGSVTVGTTNPLFMLTIPATSAANVEFTNGITFSNAGWSAAATSTAGGNGAPSTALEAVFFFK